MMAVKTDWGEICDRYATEDTWGKVIHQPNAGVSAARNVGLENATGENFCFVDSDDEVSADFIKGFAQGCDLPVQGYTLQLRVVSA